jgi:hypothetical protein
MQISPLGDFQVEAMLPVAESEEVRAGTTASVRFGGDVSSAVEATVVEVDESDANLRRTVLQLVSHEVPVALGESATVVIRVDERTDVFVLPLAALRESETGTAVLRRAPDGTESMVKIKTGLRGSNGLVEVTDGLVVGDAVIVARGDPNK